MSNSGVFNPLALLFSWIITECRVLLKFEYSIIAPSLNPTLVVEDKRSTQVSWVGLWPDPPFEWVSESTYSVECSLVACVMCSFRACLVCSFKACLVCSFRDCLVCSFRACLVCSFRACLVCSFRASGSLRFARSAPENPLSGFGGWGGGAPPLRQGRWKT